MPFQQVEANRQAATQIMEKAIAQLMAAGVARHEAQERVKRNFQALNLSGAHITVDALCLPS